MNKLQKFKKLFFTIALIFTIYFFSYSVNAAEDLYDSTSSTKNGDTVYFVKPDNWSDSIPNIYAWNDSQNIASYPGIPMTLVNGNLYKYEFDSDAGFTKVIFSDSTNPNFKTSDLDFICSEYVYDNCIKYIKSGDIIYFTNTYGDNTYIYLYNSATGDSLSAWPGEKMDNIGDSRRYVLNSDKQYDKIIFNNGSGSQSKTFNYEGNYTMYYTNSFYKRTFLVSGDTLYFEKPDSWNNNIYIYMWNSLNSNSSWNTTTMTHISGNTYSYTLSNIDNITLDGFNNVIFSDGTSQTKDLSIVGKSTTFKAYDTPIADGSSSSGKYDGFWAYEKDKSSLSKLVQNTTIPTSDEVYYTVASYKLYKEQYDLAKLLVNTKYILASHLEYTSQYDKSLIALQFAYDNLKLDTKILSDKINEMKNVDTSKYEQSLVDAFNISISNAENILTNTSTLTISSIKNAINKMDTAYNNLVVDKYELENLINKANSIDTSIYTDESVSILLDSIQDATDVLNDSDASHYNVQDQISKLNDAIEKLVKKDVQDSNEDMNNNNTENQSDANIITTNNSNPSTSDILHAFIGAFILGIAIYMITTAYLKKHKIRK